MSVYKLADTCDDLNDMGDLGKLLVDAFDAMRYVIVLASRSKKPANLADLVPLYIDYPVDRITRKTLGSASGFRAGRSMV